MLIQIYGKMRHFLTNLQFKIETQAIFIFLFTKFYEFQHEIYRWMNESHAYFPNISIEMR